MIASSAALLLCIASLAWATPLSTTAVTTTHPLERRAPETFRGRQRSTSRGRWGRRDRHFLERRGWSSSRRGWNNGRRYSTSRRGRAFIGHRGWLQRRALSAEPKANLERRGYYSSRRRYSTSRNRHIHVVPVQTRVIVPTHHHHGLYRRAVWGHAAGDADDQWHDAMSRAGKLPGHFPNDLDDQIKHAPTTFNSPGLWNQRRTWTGTTWNNGGTTWNNGGWSGRNNGWNRHNGGYDSDHHDSWDEKAQDDTPARAVEAEEDTPKAKSTNQKAKVPRKTLERRWIRDGDGDSFRGRNFNTGFHGGNFGRFNSDRRGGRFWSEAGAERDDKVEEEDTKKKVTSQDVKTAKMGGASTSMGGAKPKLQRRGYNSDDGYGSDSGSGSDSGYGHSHHGRPRYGGHRPRRVIHRTVHVPVHHHHVVSGY